MSIGPIAWDEDSPDGATDTMDTVDDEIRAMKEAVRKLLEVEHYPFSDEKAGEHKQGSARALVDTEANIEAVATPPVGKVVVTNDSKLMRVTVGTAGEFLEWPASAAGFAVQDVLAAVATLTTQVQFPGAVTEVVWTTSGGGVNNNPQIPLVVGAGATDFELEIDLLLNLIKYDVTIALNWAVAVEYSIDARASWLPLDTLVSDAFGGSAPLLYQRRIPFDPTKTYDFRVTIVASSATYLRINFPGAGAVPASTSRFTVTRRRARYLAP